MDLRMMVQQAISHHMMYSFTIFYSSYTREVQVNKFFHCTTIPIVLANIITYSTKYSSGGESVSGRKKLQWKFQEPNWLIKKKKIHYWKTWF